MTRGSVRSAVRSVWHRMPQEWRRRLANPSVSRLLYRTLWAPPGHFYSPYAKPSDIRRLPGPPSVAHAVSGVDLRLDAQLTSLPEIAAAVGALEIPVDPTPGRRYHLANAPFAHSDGVVLGGMLAWLRPARFVEVGSGWSTCLALDVRDRCGAPATITVIDPFPDARIVGESVDLHRSRLQDVDLDVFDRLEAGDVLFVDSTHVAKAGSDVNRLVFEVLPRLRSGVHVHVHDVHWPFEYPTDWLLGGRAWNETYVLRAFLQFNSEYEVSIWPSALHHLHRDVLERHLPEALVNEGGGSIWLRRR